MNHQPVLTLYSRAGCGLCGEMLDEIRRRYADRVQVRVVDIAGDSALEARHGHRIPVLAHGDEELCFGRLLPERVDALLAPR